MRFFTFVACIVACIILHKKSIAQTLVGYYPFNQNAQDESGNTHHGVVTGASLTSDRFGISNSAYFFDGVDDYIDVGDNFDEYPELSISAWVYLDHDATASDYHAIVHKHKNGSQNNLKSFALSKNGSLKTFYARYYDGSPDCCADVQGEEPAENEKWYHIVTTFDNGTSKLYVNGALVDSFTGTSIVQNTTTPTYIGSNYSTSQSQTFDGKIDDVIFYEGILSHEQVDSLFNVGNWVSFSNVVAYYPFNGNAMDESGNNYDGTVNGAVLTTDRFGKEKSAYFFDGIDDHIITGAIDLAGKDFSISIWENYQDFGGGGAWFFGQGTNPSLGNSLSGGYRTGTQATFGFYISDLDYDFVELYNWKQWVYAYDATEDRRTIYLNGQQMVYDTSTTDYNGVGDFFIGRTGFSTSAHFQGSLDDLSIYSKALEPEEVANIFLAESQYCSQDRDTLTFFVHDTITVEVQDTLLLPIYDTIQVTEVINVYDTLQVTEVINVYDTLQVTEVINVYDTIHKIAEMISVYDTLTIFDTLYFSVINGIVYEPLSWAGITLFPNPTPGDINLVVEKGTIQKISILQFDGRIVREFIEPEDTIFLDVDDGIYLMLVDLMVQGTLQYYLQKVVVSN